jgi:hypothetical protein
MAPRDEGRNAQPVFGDQVAVQFSHNYGSPYVFLYSGK